ncbi:uncharacterized protein PGTG_17615 [Puccinia graminis f. sp. tritici CRL 75-36-700-3]|uniref:Uncharacterized protein n=1 Tax=Puccinia graminis f. sp. tritici (strain CRL 75-36-700-3 / race SCCL) TaxID=418459 RepID=E3L4T6_PUCGT|nr:uncharacterized protein PGTG_17615 [Puccinia graminis f. sp. tritici CRL 75-36-700-3]EFP91561.2 hypothetical protein PGTG_17615 [Puccinia graminis f. sp. tritici CRL 75-36-700-3]
MITPVPQEEKESPPHYLQEHLAGYHFTQVHQLHINSKDVCKKGYFVVIFPRNKSPKFIGRVESIWKGQFPNRKTLYVKITRFQVKSIDQFYNMTALVNEKTIEFYLASVGSSSPLP